MNGLGAASHEVPFAGPQTSAVFDKADVVVPIQKWNRAQIVQVQGGGILQTVWDQRTESIGQLEGGPFGDELAGESLGL